MVPRSTLRRLAGVLLLAALGLPPALSAQAHADGVPGGRLAFEAGQQHARFSPVGLFSVGASATDVLSITPLVASGAQWGIGAPTWSPDGRRVAFARFVDGSPDIFVADADGGRERRITADPAWDYEPAWSPDGSRIAFMTNRFLSETDSGAVVATVAPDGSDLRRLTSERIIAGSPAWSPDGRWIAFSNVVGTTESRSVIWLMAADGSGERQVTSGPYDRDPAIAQPRGGRLRIAYTSRDSPEGEADILQVRVRVRGSLRAGRPRPLVADRAEEIDPAWSPDGRHLAFARFSSSPVPWSRLMLRDGRFGRERELLPGGGEGWALVWFQSPAWAPCAPGARSPDC
jgi:Tol biopolymer transport system component